MPYFPQLSTGAMAQYPVTRRRVKRTVFRDAMDGGPVKLADAGGERVEWLMRLTGLSAAEAEAIENLFSESEGQLKPFTFLDPADNLLVHSESLGQTVWAKSPLMQVTASVADPWGTTRASRLVNAGSGPAWIAQEVAGPGGYVYCFSAWIRGSGDVTLARTAGTESASETFVLGSEWRRVESTARLDTSPSPVRFEVRVPAAGAVEIGGLQADAQPAASGYRRTGARSGVYPAAVFAQDQLLVRAEGFGHYATSLHIVSLMGI